MLNERKVITYCHREQTWLVVLEREVLVRKLVSTENSPGASPVAIDEITTLEHKVFDLPKYVSGGVEVK